MHFSKKEIQERIAAIRKHLESSGTVYVHNDIFYELPVSLQMILKRAPGIKEHKNGKVYNVRCSYDEMCEDNEYSLKDLMNMETANIKNKYTTKINYGV